MPPETHRPTTSALLLLDFARAHGVAAQTVLQGSRWSAPQLSAAGAVIGSHEELQLIANTVAALGNRAALGLDMGVRYHLTAYGIWGFALMSAPTLRAAFEIGLRYLDLTYSYLAMSIVPHGQEVALELDDRAVPPTLRRFLVERDIAAIATILRELFLHALEPRRIELAFPAPDNLVPYKALFGFTPAFGAAKSRVVFDVGALDQPLPQANPLAAQLAENQCRQLLTQRRARSGTAGQVRDLLLKGVGGRLPDIETVATHLNLTSRTLRRRLDREGTSYRVLLDELRQTLAEELLGTAGMKLSEVAERLGYAEPASFQHARRRWRAAANASR